MEQNSLHATREAASTRPRAERAAVLALGATLMAAGALALCLHGCAPQAASGEGATDEDAVQADFAFSADADCAACHATEGASLEDASCPASNHAGQACTTCHSDIEALSAAHDGAAYGDTMPKRLKTTEVDESACTNDACHGSLDSLAEKTAGSAVLVDSAGTTANPHALPEVEDHETLDCGSCHDMHASDDVSETAQKACKSCHHMGVFECYTCHD